MLENLLKPNPVLVGQRIASIKDELGVSFTELGNRLGVPKPTISSYVYGKSLAPQKVVEKLAKMSGKKVGWFYYGDLDEYITQYLILTGHTAIISEFPSVVNKMKHDFLFGANKNSMWENEFGYPVEEFLDDCFAEYRYEINKRRVETITKEFITNNTTLDDIRKEEAITLVATDIFNAISIVGHIEFDDKVGIESMVEDYYNKHMKDKGISFNDEYLVGKLINVLADDEQTADLIHQLSMTLTDKQFTGFFGGQELVEVFQAMRPALINLYAQNNDDDFYDWFVK